MEDVTTLTKIQLDALREVGNIGSGNAASALAQFLNRKIDMAVPSATILDFKEIPSLLGGPGTRVMGIFLKVLGEISGRFLLLIPEKTSIKLQTLIPGAKLKIRSTCRNLRVPVCVKSETFWLALF